MDLVFLSGTTQNGGLTNPSAQTIQLSLALKQDLHFLSHSGQWAWNSISYLPNGQAQIGA